MLERQLQIEIIEGSPSKRDFCYAVFDESVRNNLTQVLDLERRLSEDSLTADQWETAITSHTRLWNKLPDYYKSELSDLAALTMQE